MTIKPVTGMQPMPLHSPDHVAALVELMESPGADTRGIGDHFTTLAGVRPEWFRPYQEQVITELLDRFEVSFADQCLLFAGASDRCVDHLVPRLGEPSSFQAFQAFRAFQAAWPGSFMGVAGVAPWSVA